MVHDCIDKGVVDDQLVGVVVVDVEVWPDTKIEWLLAAGAGQLGNNPLTRVIEE